MTNLGKYLIALALVLGLLGALSFFGLTPFGKSVVQEVTTFGSDVVSNVQWFTTGYKYGALNAVYNSASLTIPIGSDQAFWTNNTGATVVVDYTPLYINGTSTASVASSTVVISVGATSTSAIKETYSPTYVSNKNTSLLVDKYSLATSSAVANQYSNGLLDALLTDNYVYHASSSPAEIRIPNGQSLFVYADSFCVTQGSCETSTSTNRGWTTITVPFRYYYSSPN